MFTFSAPWDFIIASALTFLAVVLESLPFPTLPFQLLPPPTGRRWTCSLLPLTHTELNHAQHAQQSVLSYQWTRPSTPVLEPSLLSGCILEVAEPFFMLSVFWFTKGLWVKLNQNMCSKSEPSATHPPTDTQSTGPD